MARQLPEWWQRLRRRWEWFSHIDTLISWSQRIWPVAKWLVRGIGFVGSILWAIVIENLIPALGAVGVLLWIAAEVAAHRYKRSHHQLPEPRPGIIFPKGEVIQGPSAPAEMEPESGEAEDAGSAAPATVEIGVKALEPTITQGPAPPLKDLLRQWYNKVWDFYEEAQREKPGPDITGMDTWAAMGRHATADTRWTSEWVSAFKRSFARHIESIIDDCQEAGVDVIFPDPYAIDSVDGIARLADRIKDAIESKALRRTSS